MLFFAELEVTEKYTIFIKGTVDYRKPRVRVARRGKL